MKTILVTGVSTGIGYAVCKRFTDAGWHVFGTVRTLGDVQNLESRLGSNFKAVMLDVTNDETIREAYDAIVSSLDGRGLNAVVNNAGISVSGPIEDIDIDRILALFNVNVFGAIRIIQKFMPLLRLKAAQKETLKPVIVNNCSVLGLTSFPYTGVYGASKFALRGLADTLRLEINNMGIDVATIAFGQIETPIWDKSLLDPPSKSSNHYDYFTFNRHNVINQFKKSAYDVNYAADKIYTIVSSTNRKCNYLFIKHKFFINLFLLMPQGIRHRLLTWKMKNIIKI